MKKLFNAFFAMFVAVSLSLLGSVNVFAAEKIQVHTAEIKVAPNSNYSITPYIWMNNTHTIGAGNSIYTNEFNAEHRYLAFETTATAQNGSAISGHCTVVLYYSQPMVSICANDVDTNGVTDKMDWIDLGASNQMCKFKISNKTSQTIKVTLTWYTWA